MQPNETPTTASFNEILRFMGTRKPFSSSEDEVGSSQWQPLANYPFVTDTEAVDQLTE